MSHCCQLFLAGIVAALVVVHNTTAEDSASESTNVLSTVVVTGTRLPTAVETAPAAISVITADQLNQSQVRMVGDALRTPPGLDVIRSSQPGAQTSLFIRGANANQTLVLIDGIRVNNAYNNAFDFANLPVENIDRIEILRGPQSMLYGSEAMGGVINIVTKHGGDEPTGSATVEGGSYDSLRTRESFGGSYGPLSLSAAGSYYSTDNDRANSEFRDANVTGNLSWQVLDKLSATVLLSYLKSHAGSPGTTASNDPNDYLQNENGLAGLTLEGQATEWWTARLVLAHSQERQMFSGLEPNPPYFSGDYKESIKTERDQADFQNILTIGDEHRILIGGTYDDSSANDTNTYSTLDHSITDLAAYGQYEYRPTDRITVNGGGRVDDYSTFGTHATWHAAGSASLPATETIFRTSVGTGFRAPSLVQTFPPFGNPDLQPEESLAWDAGFEQPVAHGKLVFGANYFQNEFNNLIISVPAPPPYYSTLKNTGSARTLGVETFATWMPVTNLTINASYTWLPVARDLTSNQNLIRRAKNTGTVGMTYRFLPRWTATANAHFSGLRPDTNFDTFPSTPVTDAGYVKLDLGLRCDVCRYFTVFGRVENVLNDRYEEVYGYPALGRAYWVGGTAHF